MFLEPHISEHDLIYDLCNFKGFLGTTRKVVSAIDSIAAAATSTVHTNDLRQFDDLINPYTVYIYS